jgi:WD40 repeat protein
LLVVAGPSGCGKSSLVRAGIVPALARRGRTAAVVMPGADPTAAIDAAVAGTESPVLVVDQFEELFVLDRPPPVVRAVCQRIAEIARDHGPAVIVVRADHLASLAVDAELGDLAERGLHLVAPLAGDALRAAIEEPARQAGLRLEPGLVDLLVRDTEGEPGALPLLSHALAETWRHRDGPVLTVEGYRATGSIRGAVARSADGLYVSLPPDQRATLRSIVLRLVTPSTDGDPVRCRVANRTLLGDPARRRVVTLLVRARLVTAAEDTVELAHEALARAWPRLQSWLDDDAAGQRTLRHLAAAAEGWDALDRPGSELYRGARLDTALEWRRSAQPDLAEVEIEFLDASVRQATSERQALAARAREQSRQNRRLRLLVTATAICLVGALIAGAVAVVGRSNAADQRDTARVEALVSRSLALRPTNRSLAALLAVEAYQRRPGAGAWSALLGTFSAAPSFVGYRHVPADQAVGGAAIVPGTSSAVVGLDGDDLALVDLGSGHITRRFSPSDAHGGGYSVVRVSSDGRVAVQLHATDDTSCGTLEVLAASDGRGCGVFSVFDIAGGRRIVGPVGAPYGIGDVAIDATGSLAALAGGYDGDVAIYRTADATLVGTVPGLARPEGVTLVRDTAAVAFGPDGRLYVGSMNGPIRAVDPATAQVVAQIGAPPMSSHNYVVPLPDGQLVAAGDEAIVAVDTATGATRWSADIRDGRHPFPCPWFTVATVAGRLYCGDDYGVIVELDLATGRRTGVTLDPQLGSVGELAVTSNGRELVAFGANAPIVSRWRLDGSGPVARRIAAGQVDFSGYDPTGRMVLVGRRDPLATQADDFHDFAIWDPTSDTAIDPIEPEMLHPGWISDTKLVEDGGVYDVVTHQRVPVRNVPPNPVSATTGTNAHRVYVSFLKGGPLAGSHFVFWTYDARTGDRIEPTFSVPGSIFTSLADTADGSRIVVTVPGDGGFTMTLFDGRTGDKLKEGMPGDAIVSIGGNRRLVGATAGNITEYDLDTLRPVGTFPGARGQVDSIQFSRDGSVMLAASNDQTVSVYDVATRTRIGDPLPTSSPLIITGWLRPDGRAVDLNESGGVAVWDIDPAHLARAACRLAGRNLTRAEWDTYLGELGDYHKTCPDLL